mgnify:CR=1 FL=1
MNQNDLPFIGFYKDKRVEVYAPTSYDAVQIAAKQLGLKPSQQSGITVLRADVEHSPAIF